MWTITVAGKARKEIVNVTENGNTKSVWLSYITYHIDLFSNYIQSCEKKELRLIVLSLISRHFKESRLEIRFVNGTSIFTSHQTIPLYFRNTLYFGYDLSMALVHCVLLTYPLNNHVFEFLYLLSLGGKSETRNRYSQLFVLLW